MYKLPEDLESKYAFVTMAAQRAEQLQTGALPKTADPLRKFTVVAQEEVATGLVGLAEESEETEGAEEEAVVEE